LQCLFFSFNNAIVFCYSFVKKVTLTNGSNPILKIKQRKEQRKEEKRKKEGRKEGKRKVKGKRNLFAISTRMSDLFLKKSENWLTKFTTQVFKPQDCQNKKLKPKQTIPPPNNNKKPKYTMPWESWLFPCDYRTDCELWLPATA
jgi:hypothetical protein